MVIVLKYEEATQLLFAVDTLLLFCLVWKRGNWRICMETFAIENNRMVMNREGGIFCNERP